MTTFRATLEAQIDVTFVDKDKAEAFFLGSEWRDCFYTFVDLDEAAEHLAKVFHNTDERWEDSAWWKHIEGFGSYRLSSDTGVRCWHLAPSDGSGIHAFECGDITIKYEMELDCTDIDELSPDCK